MAPDLFNQAVAEGRLTTIPESTHMCLDFEPSNRRNIGTICEHGCHIIVLVSQCSVLLAHGRSTAETESAPNEDFTEFMERLITKYEIFDYPLAWVISGSHRCQPSNLPQKPIIEKQLLLSGVSTVERVQDDFKSCLAHTPPVKVFVRPENGWVTLYVNNKACKSIRLSEVPLPRYESNPPLRPGWAGPGPSGSGRRSASPSSRNLPSTNASGRLPTHTSTGHPLPAAPGRGFASASYSTGQSGSGSRGRGARTPSPRGGARASSPIDPTSSPPSPPQRGGAPPQRRGGPITVPGRVYRYPTPNPPPSSSPSPSPSPPPSPRGRGINARLSNESQQVRGRSFSGFAPIETSRRGRGRGGGVDANLSREEQQVQGGSSSGFAPIETSRRGRGSGGGVDANLSNESQQVRGRSFSGFAPIVTSRRARGRGGAVDANLSREEQQVQGGASSRYALIEPTPQWEWDPVTQSQRRRTRDGYEWR